MNEITNYLYSIEPRTYVFLLFLPLVTFAAIATLITIINRKSENMISCIIGLISSSSFLLLALGLVDYCHVEKFVVKGEKVFLLIDGKETFYVMNTAANASALFIVPIITTILIALILIFKK